MSYTPKISCLLAAVKDAATPIRDFFRTPQTRTIKADGSPVTTVDIAVHQALLEWGRAQDIGYIGEEGNGDVDQEYILYVDPLDGTSSWSAGIPTATVAVSIMSQVAGSYYAPIISVIHDPLLGHSWLGCQGRETWFDDGQRMMRVTADTVAKQKLITSICPPGAFRHVRAVREDINALQPELKHQACGSLALCGGLIASGMTHGLIFGGRSAAEVCAMLPIVRGAGGETVDFGGSNRTLGTFELLKHRGKLDFTLPCGVIMACNLETTRQLQKLVAQYL